MSKISTENAISNLVLLGSTGSIGVNTLNVIRHFKDKFRVKAITANSNIDLLEEQINEFTPEYVVVNDLEKSRELASRVDGKCKVLSGEEGLIEITRNLDYDILVTALVGFAGLAPTIESIKRGKRIALANKETLVVAGELIVDLLKEHQSEIIPVDSEHSAIFQALVGEDVSSVNRLILTASGGPFFNKSEEELKAVSIKEALNHPSWNMGDKITIDSATMMNKGLEVIEAHWLFRLPKDKIDVVIHPQSIIHSMVEFCDGSIKAQMSIPDMKLPIQYALTYPNRFCSNFVTNDLVKIGALNFFEPDHKKFECLNLAYDVMTTGGSAPCILNAANEVAVDLFLKEKISFMQIPDTIKYALDKVDIHSTPDLSTIFECDKITRELLKNFYN